jgi:hypothetical protein
MSATSTITSISANRRLPRSSIDEHVPGQEKFTYFPTPKFMFLILCREHQVAQSKDTEYNNRYLEQAVFYIYITALRGEISDD